MLVPNTNNTNHKRKGVFEDKLLKKRNRATQTKRKTSTAELDLLEPCQTLMFVIDKERWIQFDTLRQKYQQLHKKIRVLLNHYLDASMMEIMTVGSETGKKNFTTASLTKHAGIFWTSLASLNEKLMQTFLTETMGSLSRSLVYSFYHSLENSKDREDFKSALQQVLIAVSQSHLTEIRLKKITKSWHVALWKTWFFMYHGTEAAPFMGTYKSTKFESTRQVIRYRAIKNITCRCNLLGLITKTKYKLTVFIPQMGNSLKQIKQVTQVTQVTQELPLELEYKMDKNDNKILVPFFDGHHHCDAIIDRFWLSDVDLVCPSQQWDHLIAESLDVDSLDEALEKMLTTCLVEMILEFLQIKHGKCWKGSVSERLTKLCRKEQKEEEENETVLFE
jgi:hypothetical protein